MNLILNRYLLEQQRLALPGIGTIQLERLPATYDFAAGLLRGPSFVGRFSKDVEAEDAHFDSYLAKMLSLPVEEARSAFRSYLRDLRTTLEVDGVWSGLQVGQLKRLSTGELILESSSESLPAPAPVTVDRIIRSTQLETTVPLALPAAPHRWWIPAVVLAVLALVMILIGYMQSNSWLFNL